MFTEESRFRVPNNNFTENVIFTNFNFLTAFVQLLKYRIANYSSEFSYDYIIIHNIYVVFHCIIIVIEIPH